MIVTHTRSEITSLLTELRNGAKTVGFVPTMGALHAGHISLIEKSRRQCDIVVCSIFVNPIQFNNPDDLARYPRTESTDLAMLLESGCDVVFMPSVSEMYPEPETTVYDFGGIEKVMEGHYRPGHFNGVAIVVRKLFEIVQPDVAYFGEKDFQQLAIIRRMVQMLQLPVQIIPCPTVREPSGLAMSSRNMRLTPGQRIYAANIYRILNQATLLPVTFSPPQVEDWVRNQFGQLPDFRLEYFSLVDSETLQPVHSWDMNRPVRGCVAVYLGDIRLIDNMDFSKTSPY